MVAKIVLGLLYGDEGKGHTVDSLCMDAQNPIVIRYSGGQQCGHLVYTDENTSHVHSSFGSGTLRGIPSYFGHECTMYLPAIAEEYKTLVSKGRKPIMFMNPLVFVTTPFDIAYNRAVHQSRGHGTVGWGVGDTKIRSNDGYKINAVDFIYPSLLLEKFEKVRNYYLNKLKHDTNMQDTFIALAAPLYEEFMQCLPEWKTYFMIKHYEKLKGYETLIFEGSQGILLDQDHGVFPNVTYARTTSRDALTLADVLGAKSEIYYVTRSYLTRHGHGVFPEGQEQKLVNNWMELNQSCEFQGEFKTANLNPAMLNYALHIDSIYHSGDVEKRNLVVTCLDQLPGFDVEKLLTKLDTSFDGVFTSESHISKSLLFRSI